MKFQDLVDANLLAVRTMAVSGGGGGGVVTNDVLTDVWDSINHLLRTSTATVNVPQPLAVSGTVSVNPHAVFQTAGPWAVSGNLTSTVSIPQPLAVSGTVSVNPHAVFQTAGPWAISGSVTTAAAAGPLAVSGTLSTSFTAVSSGTLTRPANSTTYTANTVMGSGSGGSTYLTFPNCVRTGGPNTGVILGCQLTDLANQSLKFAGELWLFSAAPATLNVDNGAFNPGSPDMNNLVGIVSFANYFVGGVGSGAAGNVVFPGTLNPNPLPFTLPSGTSLFGYLIVRVAYIPITGEVFNIRLLLSED